MRKPRIFANVTTMPLANRVKLSAQYGLRAIRAQGALPSFLLIGAQKAGTTSLFNYLCESPNIVPPLRKEVHFFDRFRLPSLSLYEPFFPEQAQDKGLITGEATPLYMFHPEVPDRIAKSGLNPKFIAILRCPMERAWSHYRHEKRKGREHLSFEEALRIEKERLRGTTDCVLDRKHLEQLQRHSYLSRGRYMEQLSRYFALFGKESVHVVSLDKMTTHPREVVASCSNFLGTAEPGPNADYGVHNAGRDNTGMPEVDMTIFREAFDDDLRALESVLPIAQRWRARLHG